MCLKTCVSWVLLDLTDEEQNLGINDGIGVSVPIKFSCLTIRDFISTNELSVKMESSPFPLIA